MARRRDLGPKQAGRGARGVSCGVAFRTRRGQVWSGPAARPNVLLRAETVSSLLESESGSITHSVRAKACWQVWGQGVSCGSGGDRIAHLWNVAQPSPVTVDDLGDRRLAAQSVFAVGESRSALPAKPESLTATYIQRTRASAGALSSRVKHQPQVLGWAPASRAAQTILSVLGDELRGKWPL